MDRRDSFAAALQRFKQVPLGTVTALDSAALPPPDLIPGEAAALQRYALAPCQDPVIDEYFRHVAKIGRAVFEWRLIRAAFLWKLEAVIRQMRKVGRERSGSFSRPSSHGSAAAGGDSTPHRDSSVSPKPSAAPTTVGTPRPMRHTSPATAAIVVTAVSPLKTPTAPPPSPQDAVRMEEQTITRILETAADFQGIPFTFQRLCELLTEPRRHYNRLDKFLRAVDKCVRVVTTVYPNGERETDAGAGVTNGHTAEEEQDEGQDTGVEVSLDDDGQPLKDIDNLKDLKGLCDAGATPPTDQRVPPWLSTLPPWLTTAQQSERGANYAGDEGKENAEVPTMPSITAETPLPASAVADDVTADDVSDTSATQETVNTPAEHGVSDAQMDVEEAPSEPQDKCATPVGPTPNEPPNEQPQLRETPPKQHTTPSDDVWNEDGLRLSEEPSTETDAAGGQPDTLKTEETPMLAKEEQESSITTHKEAVEETTPTVFEEDASGELPSGAKRPRLYED